MCVRDGVGQRPVVDVHLVDRPGMPYLGSGECGQGPAAAAIANAFAHATGRRVRDLPLRPDRVRKPSAPG